MPAVIELLDARQLLSAVVIAAGPETQVNTFTTGDQRQATVAMDAGGDYVAAWWSYDHDGSGRGIFAQRYNAAGVPQGSEFQVNTYTTSFQECPSVAMDAAGDFVITWMSIRQDGSGYGVYAQRYNSAGVAQGGEFRVNSYTTDDQWWPSAAMDASGNFVITWQNAGQDGSGNGVYAQRYDAAGSPRGTEFQVNSVTTGSQEFPAVAMDAAGDFVVTWESYGDDGSSWGIAAQRYNAAGVTQGSEFLVNTQTAGEQSCPAVAMDATGDFVITWTGLEVDVDFQRYNSAGIAQGGEVTVNTGGVKTAVAMDDAGDFVVGWNSFYGDIYAQPYSASGAAQEGEFRVNSYTTGSQVFSSGRNHPNSTAAMDSAGDFVLVWGSDGQDGSGYGIYSQRYKVDVPPQLSQIETTPLSLVGTSSIQISSTLSVSDQVSQDLMGATVRVSGNYQSDEDVLDFTNTATISGSWNAANGTLTLTGSDTVANYQAALHSVTYRDTVSAPNSATRTIEFQVTDGVLASNSVSRDLTVRATSTSPVLSGINGTTNFVENGAAVTIAPNLVVDSLNVARATVSFTNWQAEDRVQFYNVYALQHTFSEDLATHTAVLTITGNDTASHYQTLLRSVIFWDVSGNPKTTVTRIAKFTVIDVNSDGGSGTQNVTVTAVNNPPVVSVNDSTLLFCQANGPAVAILINALVTDPDSTNLTKLTVQITSGYQNDADGHDVLSFVNELGITGQFDATTATLTLSGTSYVGNYREALRKVMFRASGSNVSATTRTFTVVATDNALPVPASSQPVTRDVVVSIDTAAPVLSQLESNPLNVIGTAPVALTSSLTTADQDSANLAGATIRISANYKPGEDRLNVTNTPTITGSWDAATGSLTLSGIDTIANYNAALHSVTYQDQLPVPNTAATRTVEFQVTDGIFTSNAVSRNLTDRATSTSPVLSGVNGTVNFVEGAAPVTIAPNLAIDSLTVTSATVSFVNWQGEDRVQFHNIYALQHTFMEDLSAHTAILTITGNGTPAHYQTLLRSVIYWDVAGNPNTTATRIAKFTVIDVNSDGGAGTQNLNVTSVNSAPVVSVNDSTPLNDPANSSAIAIMGRALITDPDSQDLTSLTVQITSGYQNDADGRDLLSFTNQLGISGVFDAATGTLTLSGTSYVGNYREALRLVTFNTSGLAVHTATRTLTVIATDDSIPTHTSSKPVTRDIMVTP